MDLSFLQPVYGYSGPFASVYLDVSRDAEDASQAIRLRWGQAREELLKQGADEVTLEALDAVIGRSEGEPGRCGQVAFAADGVVVFDVLVASPPQDWSARVGPLPHPMPFLARRGQHVPYVLVLADSAGAELRSVDIAGTRRVTSVEGEDYPLHKPREGGEHHKQMQRAVDEQMKQNAARVADEVQHLAVGGGADVIVLAGDVQARSVLRQELPDGLGEVVETDVGSRAAGSEGSPLDDELADILESRARQRVRSVIADYDRERGNDGRAAEGLEATVYALQRGQVGTLLWCEDALGETAELWIGPRPEQLGFSEPELTNMGVEQPRSERADAALVRAAVGTSAHLVFVPSSVTTLSEGVGAVLRFGDPTLPG